MSFPIANNKGNQTNEVDDHPQHHNDLANAANDHEARIGVLETGEAGDVLTGTATPTLGSMGLGETYFQTDSSGNVINEYVKTSA